jgi:hypothetical protein
MAVPLGWFARQHSANLRGAASHGHRPGVSGKSVGRLSPLREERRPSRPITVTAFGTDPKIRCGKANYFRFVRRFAFFFLALRFAILHSPLLIG